MRIRPGFYGVIAACVAVLGASLRGQCSSEPAWDPAFDGAPYDFGNPVFAHPNWLVYVRALAGYDDGTGPAIYSGGQFYTDANPFVHEALVKRTSAGWTAVPGLTPVNIGWPWFCPGTAPVFRQVLCLKTVQVAGTSVLAVGGRFDSPGGASVGFLSGQTWLPLGGATGTTSGNCPPPGWCGQGSSWGGSCHYHQPEVDAIESFDDGGGSKVYVAGIFSSLGGVNTGCIGRLNGTSWESCGAPVSQWHNGSPQRVSGLIAGDLGAGPRLFAFGFASDPASPLTPTGVMAYDGATWTPVGAAGPYAPGPGGSGYVSASYGFAPAMTAAIHDDGSGPALYVSAVDPATYGFRVCKWDGVSWTAMSTAGSVYTDGLGFGFPGAAFLYTPPRLVASSAIPWGNLAPGIASPSLHAFPRCQGSCRAGSTAAAWAA